MRKDQFESRVRILLPKVTDEAMTAWTNYGEDLDWDEVEAEEQKEITAALRVFQVPEVSEQKLPGKRMKEADRFCAAERCSCIENKPLI